VSESLYERYKEALRRGHLATQRGRLDEALDAYGEAARLAPDRALPLVGIGAVLDRLGKTAEALTTYDRALDRAPNDESALRGRVDVLMALGDRAGAAETLDRLAAVLDAAGRRADALDAARLALELAESRGRRAALRAMVDRYATSPAGAAPASPGDEALARATALLDGPLGPEAPPPEPPFDPAAAMAAVDAAAEAGDPEAVLGAALAAARGHRASGQHAAAIDACYQALATNPADPALHLALTEIYVDRGWRTVAADKLVLLARLADLAGDTQTRGRLCELAGRLPGDPRLEAICA
jgi:tetratricopeptide (TPR) repeat protein